MPTEQCVFLMLYIHGILYMYITKYSCVFLKLGESIYVAMDLIPILLGALPLAHNAQHSLVYVDRYILASVPGLPRSVRVLIMRMRKRQTFGAGEGLGGNIM